MSKVEFQIGKTKDNDKKPIWKWALPAKPRIATRSRFGNQRSRQNSGYQKVNKKGALRRP